MGVYTVSVEVTFPASHQLRMHDGRLEPLHGHQWRVRAKFAGTELDNMDVLIDFVRVESLLGDILAGLRDRHLNDLPHFEGINPSAENVARWIFDSLRESLDQPELLRKITVWEAPHCAAGYEEQ
jgi:6-pyruvoyltetrahydropterin/6-carboxytetrahydropterin synthase